MWEMVHKHTDRRLILFVNLLKNVPSFLNHVRFFITIKHILITFNFQWMLQYVWNGILYGVFKNFHFWYFRSKDSSGVEFKLEHIHETDSKWSLTMEIENGDAKDDTLKPVRVSKHFVQKQWIIKYTSDCWQKKERISELCFLTIHSE